MIKVTIKIKFLIMMIGFISWSSLCFLTQSCKTNEAAERNLYNAKSWYLDAQFPENCLQGIIQINDVPKGPGSRTHHLILVMEEVTLPVYDPETLLGDHLVGQAVGIFGKIIIDPSNGFNSEIWMGKLGCIP